MSDDTPHVVFGNNFVVDKNKIEKGERRKVSINRDDFHTIDPCRFIFSENEVESNHVEYKSEKKHPNTNGVKYE